MSLRKIIETQRNWAGSGRSDPGRPTYARSLGDNLFAGRLDRRTESEFLSADGSELQDTPRRPAKMRALASSSALAVNFFDPWRAVSLDPLSPALGLNRKVTGLRFEHVCASFPVGPRSPNLDLLLALEDGTSVAVESKFSEPYRKPGRRAKLSPKYFLSSTGLWSEVGMSGAQRVADTIHSGWCYLDVGQLLKHLLGLAHDGCARYLLYLWYDTGRQDAEGHREEIVRFTEAVANERIEFRARTYQEVFRSLIGSPDPVGGWSGYMRARYFAG